MFRNLPTILGSGNRLRKAPLETTARGEDGASLFIMAAVEVIHKAAEFCQNTYIHIY